MTKIEYKIQYDIKLQQYKPDFASRSSSLSPRSMTLLMLFFIMFIVFFISFLTVLSLSLFIESLFGLPGLLCLKSSLKCKIITNQHAYFQDLQKVTKNRLAYVFRHSIGG